MRENEGSVLRWTARWMTILYRHQCLLCSFPLLLPPPFSPLLASPLILNSFLHLFYVSCMYYRCSQVWLRIMTSFAPKRLLSFHTEYCGIWSHTLFPKHRSVLLFQSLLLGDNCPRASWISQNPDIPWSPHSPHHHSPPTGSPWLHRELADPGALWSWLLVGTGRSGKERRSRRFSNGLFLKFIEIKREGKGLEDNIRIFTPGINGRNDQIQHAGWMVQGETLETVDAKASSRGTTNS